MDDDRRISAVIFDLDGTLLDTEHVTKDVLKEVLVRYGKVVDLDKEKKRHGMAHRWKEYFSVIVGSEEVKSGKPSPDMVGIRAGKAANMQVVAVPSIQSESDEYLIADHVIHSFLDFQPELWALPPFEDWVMKALPIEPFHFKGSYENGFLQESSDNGASDLVGQAWGVYFGWVEVDSQERLKIVVDIRWDHCCGAYRRNISCIWRQSTSKILTSYPVHLHHANHPSQSPKPSYNAFFISLQSHLRLLSNTTAMNGRRISAVIFDMDGTLLNTEFTILKQDDIYGFAFASINTYCNHLQIQLCSSRWLQAKALPGVNRLIKHLHKHGIPYAVASNSIKKNVEVKVSAQKGWKEYFSVILGSDEVKSGKPSPDLFLEAANRMSVDASCCLVVEDSVVGIKAGKAAKMQVVAVPSIQSESDQYLIADHVIHSFLDFHPELWALPPFDDWVMKALPIEPIHFEGSYRNGFLQENADNEASDLPGQAWGVYFGWVEVDSLERFKIVVSIRWDRSCGAFRRNIQACFINGSDGQISDQLMEVTLVGYIRGFPTKDFQQNLSTNAQILDQDKSIAEACLDLAAYNELW
ncbi:HAD-like domain-containing protein [Cynara cardunculus var. scolymus]|uniref:riboflavin kinase n=1 Tax=Cynara cardunculus var. scolymus TaxID=59895 RepID=A0A118K2H0_CYNCS|nr:HAD-like domain-containing protein [Cynara cardunculus var. scolymus]